MLLEQSQISNLEFNHKIYNLYQQIKKMKLKNCVTFVKATNSTETAKIVKKSLTNRSAGTNAIFFKMEDFIDWSIHEHNFNEIIVKEDSIQLFDNELYIVTFTK